MSMFRRRIIELSLPNTEHATLEIPLNTTFLGVSLFRQKLRIWALVDENEEKHTHIVSSYLTGFEVPSQSKHIGTINERGYVYHVFIRSV